MRNSSSAGRGNCRRRRHSRSSSNCRRRKPPSRRPPASATPSPIISGTARRVAERVELRRCLLVARRHQMVAGDRIMVLVDLPLLRSQVVAPPDGENQAWSPRVVLEESHDSSSAGVAANWRPLEIDRLRLARRSRAAASRSCVCAAYAAAATRRWARNRLVDAKCIRFSRLAQNFSTQGRSSSSCVQALRGCCSTCSSSARWRRDRAASPACPRAPAGARWRCRRR